MKTVAVERAALALAAALAGCSSLPSLQPNAICAGAGVTLDAAFPSAGRHDCIVAPDGSRSIAQLRIGKSYFRKAGVEHDVLNETKDAIVFLEVELKA